MPSTPMDVDSPAPVASSGAPSLNITRTLGSTTELAQIIANFRPVKLFHREIKDGRPQPHVLSLDFDDLGELCMTSESDETIQIYNAKEGRHDKSLLSKKYGAKLAKFTHSPSSIIYASTKQNDAIRYLATHDNSFIRYFEGHEGSVTSLAVNPGQDNFVSCSLDGTVRLWDLRSKNWQGLLYLRTPYLTAWDPSGKVFGVASPASGSILLYAYNKYKTPFTTLDIVEQCRAVDQSNLCQGWTKLQFSNDGKSVLLGTRGSGHFLLDAFDGTLKAYLRKPEGSTRRAAVGEGNASSAGDTSTLESSGDCCFTPDGRFVMSGTKQGVLVWDSLASAGQKKILEPTHVLDDKRETAVIAFNTRYNHFATADQDLMFWQPDPHA